MANISGNYVPDESLRRGNQNEDGDLFQALGNAIRRALGGGSSEQTGIPITGDAVVQTQADTRLTGDVQNAEAAMASRRGTAPTGGGGRELGVGRRDGGGGGGRPPVTGGTGGNTGGGSDGGARNMMFDRNALLGGALNDENLARNVGRVGTYGLIGAQGVGNLLQGRTIQGATELTAGMGTAALTRAAGRRIGGRAGAALQIAAPLVGSVVGSGTGQELQRQYTRATGRAAPGEEGSLGAQLGQTEQVAKLISEINKNDMNTSVSALQQIGRNEAELDLEFRKKLAPILEQANRNQLVRQQALLNTMGQQYAMLGTVATAGALAKGSQAERGAYARQALVANPYSNAVLQAPSISFG
jgi:hypothetical protein